MDQPFAADRWKPSKPWESHETVYDKLQVETVRPPKFMKRFRGKLTFPAHRPTQQGKCSHLTASL